MLKVRTFGAIGQYVSIYHNKRKYIGGKGKIN